MLENIIGNATPVELIWTTLGAIGLYVGTLNAWEALHDFRSLGGLANGRRVIATDNIRRETLRAFSYLQAIVLGVIASFAPPAPVRSETSYIGSLILIGILSTLVINSYLDRRSRLYLMRTGITSRDHRELTQDEAEDLKFGTERRALESQHLDES